MQYIYIYCINFDFWLVVKVLVWSLRVRKKKWKRVKLEDKWRFFLSTEVNVTFLIDSPMVFFAGISIGGGWIIRNVFLLVSDLTQRSLVSFFSSETSSKKPLRWGRKGSNLNDERDPKTEENYRSNAKKWTFDNNNKWKRRFRLFVLAESEVLHVYSEKYRCC